MNWLKEKFAALREEAKGWKTIVFARVYIVGGFLVALYDAVLPLVAGVDWSPITDHFPRWVLPVFVMGTGLAFEALRRLTTGPVGSKGDEQPDPDVKAGD